MDRSCGDFTSFLGQTARAIPVFEPCCSRDADRHLMTESQQSLQKMPVRPSPYTVKPQISTHSSTNARPLPGVPPMADGVAAARTPPPRSSLSPKSAVPSPSAQAGGSAHADPPPSIGSAATFESAESNLSSARSNVSQGSPADDMCAVISRSKLCQGLNSVLLREVLSMMKHHICKQGQLVARQGEAARSMFFVLSGQVGVMVEGRQVAMLHRGDFFGEAALCSAACVQIESSKAKPSLAKSQVAARSADCRAVTDVELVELDATALTPLLTRHQDIFDNYNRILKGQAVPGSGMVPARSP